jgi:fatty acid desaturase
MGERMSADSVTMVPAIGLLVAPTPDGPILANGRPKPELRDSLRRIPSVRNASSVLGCAVQTLAIMALAARTPGWWRIGVWPVAFVLMGRAHAQVAALMHEAAHRLLFRNRRANDLVGRWALGYVGFTNTDGYRRVHMAHHRDEFGPEEPDKALYAGYPIAADSFRRKLIRDATGRTGVKLMRQQFAHFRSTDERARRTVTKIYAVQFLLAVASWLVGYPLVYWLLWLLPYLTVWRVINRLRSIAEHGGMIRSDDRRQTTHSVRQHALSRFFVVPYWIGWHLAHHCDSGIPMRNLPRYHRELAAAGYVTDALEYSSYHACWRALRR